MSLSKQQIEDQLLAYHMGWLDRAEMEAVERLIGSSPEVADRSRAVRHRYGGPSIYGLVVSLGPVSGQGS